MGRGQGQSAPRKLPRPLVDGSYVSLVSRVFILRLMSFSVAVGRWQKNKDLSWYAKNDDSKEATDAAAARMEEIRRIKEAEQDALSQALGYPVEPRLRDSQVAQPKEVEKALRETAEGDEEGGKGIGFGAYAGAGDKAGDNEEMMVGYAGDLGGLEGGNVKKKRKDKKEQRRHRSASRDRREGRRRRSRSMDRSRRHSSTSRDRGESYRRGSRSTERDGRHRRHTHQYEDNRNRRRRSRSYSPRRRRPHRSRTGSYERHGADARHRYRKRSFSPRPRPHR